MLDKSLLEIMVCPHCKGGLTYNAQDQELVCKVEQFAYPIRDGIPVLLVEEARTIAQTGDAEHKADVISMKKDET